MNKYVILLLLFFPFTVKALSLECPPVVSLGEKFSCEVKDNNSIGIVSHIQLDNGLSYSSFRINSDWKAYYYSSNGFSVKKVSDQSFTGSLFFQVNSNALVGNSYSIHLVQNEGVNSSYQYVPLDDVVSSVRVISDVNTLDKLLLNKGNISLQFNKDTLNYEVSTYDDAINIEAIVSDNGAKIEGDVGVNSLNIGANIFQIKVTSERGNSRVYQIIVTRKIKNLTKKESKKYGLKSLSVNGKNIDLVSNKYLYSLSVSYDVSQLDVKAISNDNKAVVSIDSPRELVYGDNQVIIKVKDTDGTEIQYVLVVSRERKKDNNTKIKNLVIDNYFISFKSNVYEYAISILDEDKLNIEVELDSNTSSYKIVGNRKLKDKSKIEIIVTAEDGSKKSYFITVRKLGSVVSNSRSIDGYLRVPILIFCVVVISLLLVIKTRRVKLEKGL